MKNFKRKLSQGHWLFRKTLKFAWWERFEKFCTRKRWHKYSENCGYCSVHSRLFGYILNIEISLLTGRRSHGCILIPKNTCEIPSALIPKKGIRANKRPVPNAAGRVWSNASLCSSNPSKKRSVQLNYVNPNHTTSQRLPTLQRNNSKTLHSNCKKHANDLIAPALANLNNTDK